MDKSIETIALTKEFERYCSKLRAQAKKYNVDLSKITFKKDINHKPGVSN